MEYEPVFGLDNIVKRFNDASHDSNNHFVEGLQYTLDEAVIMTAVMVPDHEVDHRKVNQICIELQKRLEILICLHFFLNSKILIKKTFYCYCKKNKTLSIFRFLH